MTRGGRVTVFLGGRMTVHADECAGIKGSAEGGIETEEKVSERAKEER
jgi:hypothetical protein